MEVALRLKFTQHPDLKALLLGTGDANIIEVRRVLSFFVPPYDSIDLGFPT